MEAHRFGLVSSGTISANDRVYNRLTISPVFLHRNSLLPEDQVDHCYRQGRAYRYGVRGLVYPEPEVRRLATVAGEHTMTGVVWAHDNRELADIVLRKIGGIVGVKGSHIGDPRADKGHVLIGAVPSRHTGHGEFSIII